MLWMRLPTDYRKLRNTVLGVLDKCTESEDERRRFYDSCRQRYLFGGDAFSQSRVNKISPVVNRKSAFTYSADSLKFWLQVTPDEDFEQVYPMLESVAEAVEDEWWRSSTDRLFGMGVTWSYVYGCSILCTLPVLNSDKRSVSLVSHLLSNPADFGVYQPEQPDILKQEAMCLTSYLPLSQVERRIRFHPRRHEIAKKLELYNQNLYAEGAIIMGYSQQGPTTFKADYAWGGPYRYMPRTSLNYYRWRDLYIFDDDLGDWRLFTITSDEIVFDRPMSMVGLPGIPPFTKVSPLELPDYFWGQSQVESIAAIQDWFMHRTDELDRFIAKRLIPPKAIIGAGSTWEERLGALNRPGGKLAVNSRDVQIQEMGSEIPKEVFEFLQGIDAFFQEQSGLRPSLFGKQEPGVRTEGMAASTMRLAAAEVRREALSLEKQAEDHGNILLHQMRRYYTDTLIDANGRPFKLAEFPDGFRVRVDGHSASPVFVEDHAQLAMTLRRFGDITPEKFIELLHPSMKGALIHDIKKIQYIKMLGQEVAKAQQEMKRSGQQAGAK